MFGLHLSTPSPCRGGAKAAAAVLLAELLARCGAGNKLEDHGEAAACRNHGSEANACGNCDAVRHEPNTP